MHYYIRSTDTLYNVNIYLLVKLFALSHVQVSVSNKVPVSNKYVCFQEKKQSNSVLCLKVLTVL